MSAKLSSDIAGGLAFFPNAPGGLPFQFVSSDIFARSELLNVEAPNLGLCHDCLLFTGRGKIPCQASRGLDVKEGGGCNAHD